jgi:3-hydroxyisobutyrate dehydrogenase-like beta-hydroxyacid dehydrogenase
MKIGWIGLGKMGLPMAQRLAAAGHTITAYGRNDDSAQKARAQGFAVARDLAGVAADADIVVSAITDDPTLAEVTSGLAPHLQRGQIYIDTSTVSPGASEAVAAIMDERGVPYLRAPVSGSTALAAAGTLTVLVSGPRDAYERMAPIFAAVSKKSFHVGEGEQARTLKLVLNTMIAATAALVAEALALGRKGGLSAADTLAVISESAVASPVIGYKRAMIEEGIYEPAFSVAQMLKDLDIVLGVGRDTHVPMPLVAMIREQFETSLVAGQGERDFFVLVRDAARRAGLPD